METNAVTTLPSVIAKHLSYTELIAWMSFLSVVSAALGRVIHAIINGGGLKSMVSAIWLGTNTPKQTPPTP